MANVLGELFQNIADAIRGKTGETGTMKPIDFPSAIASIVTGSGGGGEGSGESLQFANGSFNTGTTGVERVTITHGKNVMPDFIAVWKTGIATMDASTRPFMSAWGMKSKFASGPQAAICCAGYAMAENDNGIDNATESQQNSGYIFCPNETTFQVGRIDSGNGQCLFVPSSAYNWIAIYGIGSGSASGGVPEDFATVTFMNGAEELFSRPVYIGDDCPDPVTQNRCDEPTKASTVQHTYDHNGWGAADGGEVDGTILQNIKADKTVYAIYKATVNKYTITYLDSDGVTVLKTEQLAYGTMPSYEPIKEGFIFSGWVETLVTVVGDATYTAKWEEDNGIAIFDGTITASYADGNYGNLYHSLITPLIPDEEAFVAGDTLVVTIDGVAYTLTAYATTIKTNNSSRSYVCVGNIKIVTKFAGSTVTSYTVSRDTQCNFCLYSGVGRIGHFFKTKGPYNVTIRKM